MSANGRENVKWVDGLRGIASLLVVFTHLTRAFDDDIFKPSSAEGAHPRILQLPIIRVLFQGRIGVHIFSLVTGYVCALKPIRLCKTGNQEKALKSITQSAFRRIPRLVLPTSISVTCIWLICQLHGFDMTKHVASWWLIYTTANRLPAGPAVENLFFNLINTWVRGYNDYEPNQWTLFPLLKGAFLVYIMLFATAYIRSRYRMMIELGLFVYFYISNEPEFGMQFFFGAFLCDLSQHAPYIEWISARRWPNRVLAPILILFGLLLASYPETKAEWMPWSDFMTELAKWIFPATHPDTPRFYSGVGLTFIALGLQFSDTAKHILSHKWLLWAGKNSFAVYLLHGTLMRTILVWLLYGITIPPDVIKEDGTTEAAPYVKLGGRASWYFWVSVWFVVLYYLANLWTTYVDSFCARITQKLEKYVIEEEEEKSILPQ